jgi:hypothetical protein
VTQQLNPWLPSTIKKARKVCEDADRKALADRMFVALIERVHHLATINAHDTRPPTIERFQSEDMVLLTMEWFDKEAHWHVCFGVRRQLGEKPRVVLDFSGVLGAPGHRGSHWSLANESHSYFADNPTDEEIRKALHDYFRAWKKE